MPGSSFGAAFRVTTAGESHGPGNVVIVDGCPPGIALSPADLRRELGRRRPGQSGLTTSRDEADEPEILSGVFEGCTTGTAIAILVRNADACRADYAELRRAFRPGHADFSYQAKYGRRDHRGGGRASARETVARVAAGAVARKVIADGFGGRVLGYVRQVGEVIADVSDPGAVTREHVESMPGGEPNLVRCPDLVAAVRMQALIEDVRDAGDSIGGVAEIVVTGMVAGLGEPVFDKLKADLGKALFSLPAVVGVEYGTGFGCVTLRGSEHNDAFVVEHPGDGAPPRVVTETNRHGGILGGIATGMPLLLRAAVKPTSSVALRQQTVTAAGDPTKLAVGGRHDPCLLPRFVPIAEAMVAIVLADHYLRWRGQVGASRSG